MNKLWAPWRMEYIINADKDKDTCIFCEFPNQDRDKENLIVLRDKHCFIILNKYPYNNGHLMVVPYEHKSDILDLSDTVLLNIQVVLKKAIRALNSTMNPHGFNIGVNMGRPAGAGIEEHIHYHIVPRWNGDTNYMPVLTGTKVVSEALEQSWEKLHNEFK
jgi:ATP adenylyltransferase